MRLLVGILMLGLALPLLGQNSQNNAKTKVPKYNPAAESVYKGKVVDVRERDCPVSNGRGSHIIMMLDDKEIEVHLAPTQYTNMVEVNIKNGDSIEVTGWKTEFEGVQTIFAREIKDGNDMYVFRAKDGTPAWIK